jgi:hypothetical protein
LALLLAACLEYIDVFPVIFLSKGHAYLGYWRSEASHDDMFPRAEAMNCDTSNLNTAGDAFTNIAKGISAMGGYGAPPQAAQVGARGNVMPWALDQSNYMEILHYVRNGDLVPLESTLLTRSGSFASAMQAGAANFAALGDFDVMLDVVRARRNGKDPVTPLPVQ